MTQKSLSFIAENEAQKYATLSSIQKIRIDSLAGINFYKMQINDLKYISEKKDKSEQIIQNVQKICFMISDYWYSLYLYCFAVYLEPVVGQNFNSEYLAILNEDMTAKCECYKKDFEIWKSKLNEYINTAKAFENNKIYEAMKKIGNVKVYTNANIILAKSLIGLVGGIADEVDKNAKVKKKDRANKSLDFVKAVENLKPIEAKRENLMLFDVMYNGRIELIKDNDEMYVKLPK